MGQPKIMLVLAAWFILAMIIASTNQALYVYLEQAGKGNNVLLPLTEKFKRIYT